MPDETQDPKPHVHVHSTPVVEEKKDLSIWFFCGILTLGYGIVLTIQGFLDLSHPPTTVLSNLHPTLYWGLFMFVFGLFYTVKFRPGKG